MGITKKGKIYWLDLRINNKRIRRSLKTDEYHVALDRYKKKREELLNISDQPSRIRMQDFWDKYLEWSWVERPVQTERDVQRFPKIQE